MGESPKTMTLPTLLLKIITLDAGVTEARGEAIKDPPAQ